MDLEEDDGIEIEITLDGRSFRPLYVDRCQLEHEGETESIQDQCGYTENRRTGDRALDITVEGIMKEDNVGAVLMATRETEASIVSGVYTGPVVVRNVLADQTADDVSWVDSSGNQFFIYGFQLQLRQPTSE